MWIHVDTTEESAVVGWVRKYLGMSLYPAQAALLNDQSNRKLFQGGRLTGKTTAVLVDAVVHAVRGGEDVLLLCRDYHSTIRAGQEIGQISGDLDCVTRRYQGYITIDYTSHGRITLNPIGVRLCGIRPDSLYVDGPVDDWLPIIQMHTPYLCLTSDVGAVDDFSGTVIDGGSEDNYRGIQ